MGWGKGDGSDLVLPVKSMVTKSMATEMFLGVWYSAELGKMRKGGLRWSLKCPRSSFKGFK